MQSETSPHAAAVPNSRRRRVERNNEPCANCASSRQRCFVGSPYSTKCCRKCSKQGRPNCPPNMSMEDAINWKKKDRAALATDVTTSAPAPTPASITLVADIATMAGDHETTLQPLVGPGVNGNNHLSNILNHSNSTVDNPWPSVVNEAALEPESTNQIFHGGYDVASAFDHDMTKEWNDLKAKLGDLFGNLP